MRIQKLFALVGAILLLTVPHLILAEEKSDVKSQRVVGGQPADPGEYPFMVALMDPSNSDGFNAHYCGGALIHPEWVLTAAHCLVNTSSVDAGLGIHSLTQWQSEGERILSSRIIMHPDYNNFTSENDIALIQLSSPANGYALATYATSESQNAAGTSAIATGWGALSQGGSYPDILYEVGLPLVSNEDCNAWGQNGSVTEDMLCAGYREGEKDTCQGDSGGPLFYYDGGTAVVVGATSWGEGCAKPDFPGVYARVSHFTEWVASYVPGSNITPTPTDTPDPDATPTHTPTPPPSFTLTPTPDLTSGLDEYEPDNDAGSATTINSGDTQGHSIFPAGDEDWLTFTLDSPSSITLETSGAGGDTYVFLYDNNGDEIDSNDDGGQGTFSLLERACESNPLPAGTYTVMIREYNVNNTIAIYNVAFSATTCTATPEPTAVPDADTYEGDDDASSASVIIDGETQTHSIVPTGDQDWLTFTVEEESNVTIQTSGDGYDTRLYLYNAADTEIDFNDDGGAGLFSLINRSCDAAPLPAGTYTVLIDEYANNGTIPSYDVRLDVTPCNAIEGDGYEDDDTANLAVPLMDGDNQNHSIFPVGDQDWMTFTLDDESAILLQTAGSTGDTRLYLYDSDENEIDFNDDNSTVSTLFSSIGRTCDVDPLPAGTYTVLVDDYNNNGVIESYDISLVVTPCSVASVTVSPTPLPDTPEPTPTTPTQAQVPLAVTLSGAESDTAVSAWPLWAIVLVAQAGLVALVLRGRANQS